MGRIGATLSGIERTLLNRLADANAAATINQLRMATEKNVNAPRDNPSAFLALARFQGQLNLATHTMANVTAAGSLVTQARSVLGQIRAELDSIRGELAKDEDQGLSAEERAEGQAKIDASIQRINDLTATTIGGRRLLDGSADFRVSGRDYGQVVDLAVHSTGPGGSNPQTIAGSVLQSGTRAELVYQGTGGSVKADDTAELTLTGSLGSVAVTVTGGEDLDDVAQRVNNQIHKTGVLASVSGDQLTLKSVQLGSDAAAEIAVASGTFATTGGDGAGKAHGTDATVELNGITYTPAGSGGSLARVHGNRLTVNQNGFHYEIELAEGFSGDLDPMEIEGGGLSFSLATDERHRSTLAIPGLQASRLGGLTGRLDQILSGGPYAGLGGHASRAIRIVDESIGDLVRVQGTTDGFYNAAITKSSSLLTDLQAKLTTAMTQTDGYDEETESTLLAKNEQLASNALASLALLDRQRQGIIDLVKTIAGLA